MLKIKDNVDLKELEKFGFKLKKSRYREQNSYVYYVRLCIRFSINLFTRELRISTCKEAFDLLFDLIKADLVEKVVE